MTEKARILAVVGPTAIGKSALAMALAERYGGEILSCDSMQIYRGMDIGTAKPTKEEQRRVLHHLIDIREPTKNYSCYEYVKDAERIVGELTRHGVLPVFCGGTGLYLDRFLSGGLDDDNSDASVRARLTEEAGKLGAHELYMRLMKIDPAAAHATHENNVKRVIRALEIYEVTGRTKTELDAATREHASPYRATVIGLRTEDRSLLYKRIDRRVDEMMEAGLLDETRRLDAAGVFAANPTAAQAIGYKELLPAVHGEVSLAEAVENLKSATRRYAKRQLTWFSAKPYVKWITVDDKGTLRDMSDILEKACALVKEGEA